MKEAHKNRVIALAVVEGGLTVPAAATRFRVSTRWIYTLLARYRTGGLDAVDPQSRRPHSNPNATSPEIIEKILTLRTTLTTQGLDAGPESIFDRLNPRDRPSVSPIWRILRRNNQVTDQPHKRPRTSWHRFEACAPNEMWQSDVTHWPLADGTDMKIISWLDDHSRKLLHATAHPEITGPIVIDTFTTTMDEHGPPTSTLTDNAMVYTTRFARGNDGARAQPNGFEQLIADLGITQKNGAPSKPTTQGKIERFHQTLKKWLAADGLADTVDELNHQLGRFMVVYNTLRPHRAIGRRTPQAAYTAIDKTFPVVEATGHIWRTRYDQVDATGTISIRYAGRLRHLGIGRVWARKRVLVLVHRSETMVINRDRGEVIAEHTLDTSKDYQKKK